VILALAITLPLGIVCAVKQKSKLDNVVQVGTILGYSIPIFIISLVFIYIFAGTLGVFPVSGMNTPGVLWVASGGLLGLLTGCIIFPFL
jgi:peptide/nickel transport system permease protein